MVSIFWTILFLVLALLFRDNLAEWSLIDSQYITYTIWILALDALVIIPFSKLRVNQKPMVYAAIKIGSVLVNLILSVVLLYIPMFIEANLVFLSSVYVDNFQIGYIFLANIIASLLLCGLVSNYVYRLEDRY
jgi:hypothetical protein